MASRFKTLIVDDERLARNKLRSMLSSYPQIQLVAEADSVRSAITAIEQFQPDVIFLDIQMPGESGFDLLHNLEHPCKVIFVTAFDEYAIRAFEVNALDYLLKPVNPERLARSIARLSIVEPPADKSKPALAYDDHLFLTMAGKSRFLKVSAIRYINAAGQYSEIFTADGEKSLVLKPLKEWQERLPQKNFCRIHRSTIINIDHVERVEKWFNYSYQVYLRGHKEPFVMSRRYAAKLKGNLK